MPFQLYPWNVRGSVTFNHGEAQKIWRNWGLSMGNFVSLFCFVSNGLAESALVLTHHCFFCGMWTGTVLNSYGYRNNYWKTCHAPLAHRLEFLFFFRLPIGYNWYCHIAPMIQFQTNTEILLWKTREFWNVSLYYFLFVVVWRRRSVT